MIMHIWTNEEYTCQIVHCGEHWLDGNWFNVWCTLYSARQNQSPSSIKLIISSSLAPCIWLPFYFVTIFLRNQLRKKRRWTFKSNRVLKVCLKATPVCNKTILRKDPRITMISLQMSYLRCLCLSLFPGCLTSHLGQAYSRLLVHSMKNILALPPHQSVNLSLVLPFAPKTTELPPLSTSGEDPGPELFELRSFGTHSAAISLHSKPEC